MKLIIAGGRDYQFTPEDHDRLHAIDRQRRVTEVVSGGASGADKCGEKWALDNAITIHRFPADWKLHGKAAGPIRNRQMAEYADAVALFPGGKGTASMFAIATELGLKIFDFRKTNETPTIMTTPKELVKQINDYLATGEIYRDSPLIRDLLLECRKYLEPLQCGAVTPQFIQDIYMDALADEKPCDSPTNITIGSVVQLKSGGPAMTVASNRDPYAIYCQWFNDSWLDSSPFHQDMLILSPLAAYQAAADCRKREWIPVSTPPTMKDGMGPLGLVVWLNMDSPARIMCIDSFTKPLDGATHWVPIPQLEEWDS